MAIDVMVRDKARKLVFEAAEKSRSDAIWR